MFFSVNKPVKIADRPYVPCICYTAEKSLEATINYLENKGIATIHNRKVFFCNGKVMEDPRRIRTPRNISKSKEEPKKEIVKEESVKSESVKSESKIVDAEKTEGF